MRTLSGWLLSLGILVVQRFLSRRNYPFWGGVLPVSYIGLMIWVFFIKKTEFETIFVVGFLVLLGIWADGRIAVKKKRKKELDKITIQDL